MGMDFPLTWLAERATHSPLLLRRRQTYSSACMACTRISALWRNTSPGGAIRSAMASRSLETRSSISVSLCMDATEDSRCSKQRQLRSGVPRMVGL